MANKNNNALLREINELIEELKKFPEDRTKATDEQKKQIQKIFTQLYNKQAASVRLSPETYESYRSYEQGYKKEATAAFRSTSPFTKMTYLKDVKNKESAKPIFQEVFKKIAEDYKLSPEEKDILATYLPIFSAEAQSVLATMQNQAEILAKLNAQAPESNPSTPQPMSEEDKTKVDTAFKTLRASLYNHQNNTPKNFGSSPNAKKVINNALRTLSANLKEIQGEFTAEQIAELQSILQPFDKANNKELGISIDKLLADANKKDGNKYKPTKAFTQLYSQMNPNYQEWQARQARINDLNQRLRGVVSQLRAEEASMESNPGEQVAAETPGEQAAAENAGEQAAAETPVEQAAADNPGEQAATENADTNDDVPPAQSEEEINQYLDEIRQSTTEEAYISTIVPKISDANIIASMALDEVNDDETGEVKYSAVQSRALALSNPDDLLVAYQYYQKNDPEKLPEIEAVIAENLRLADHKNLNPENAFVWLTLADKIKDNEEHQSAYDAFTTGLADQMRQYDQETYKGLDAGTLAQNYEAAKQGLESLDNTFLQSLIEGYEFTDDKGAPLTDKNRGRIMSVIRGGKGNDRSETLDGLFETVRLMAAQELAAEGLPDDPDLRKQALESKMREQMSKILHIAPAPSIVEGAKLVADLQKTTAEKDLLQAEELLRTNIDRIEKYFKAQKEKITNSTSTKEEEKKKQLQELEKIKKQNIRTAQQSYQQTKQRCEATIAATPQIQQHIEQQLLAGDEKTILSVADTQARTEMNLPLDKEPDFKDEEQKRKYLRAKDEYLQALKDGQRKSTTFTKSELGARLGGVMTATHAFQSRNSQKFKGTELDKKSNSWWKRIDEKLTKKFGTPYTEGKKWTKKISNIAWNVSKGIAITATVSAVAGPLGVAAVTGYYAVKQWKNVAKQLKDKEVSKQKKAALVLGALVTSALSAATAAAGLGGMESLNNALSNPAILQHCANFTSSLGLAGRAAINAAAVTLPNWVERQVIRNKRKKLDKQIAEEKDPQKLAKLLEEHKKLEISRMQNNEELLTKGLSVGAGLLIGGAISAHGSNTNGANAAHGTQPEVSSATPGVQQPSQPEIGVAATDSTTTVAPDSISSTNHTVAYNAMQQQSAPTDSTLVSGESGTPVAAAAPATNDNAPTTDPATDANVQTPEQQAASNLSEARTAGTGHNGNSSYDSTHDNLNDYKGSLGDMSDAEVTATAQKMCEVYGDDAYKATHAALAEPRHLANAMGLTNQDFGLQPGATLTSAQMLNYLQTHDMSSNEGYQSYMETHYHGENQHFTPSERPAPVQNNEHITPQQPTAVAEVGNEAAVQPSGFHYEVVDHLPGQQPQSQHQESQQPTTGVYANTHVTNHPPVHYSAGYELDQRYSDTPYSAVLAGTTKSNGQTVVGIYLDQRTGDFVEHTITPAGIERFNTIPQTEEYNIQDRCEQEIRHPSMHTRYAHGTGYIGHSPYNNVDRAIDIGNASAEAGHVVTGVLERFGVLGHRDASNIHVGLAAGQDLSRIGQDIYHMSKWGRS